MHSHCHVYKVKLKLNTQNLIQNINFKGNKTNFLFRFLLVFFLTLNNITRPSFYFQKYNKEEVCTKFISNVE
jgi:hypothetical protein